MPRHSEGGIRRSKLLEKMKRLFIPLDRRKPRPLEINSILMGLTPEEAVIEAEMEISKAEEQIKRWEVVDEDIKSIFKRRLEIAKCQLGLAKRILEME